MVPSDVGDTQRADIDALFSFMLSRKPGNCYSVGSTQVLFGRFLVGEIDALFGVRIFSSEDPAISHGFNICFNAFFWVNYNDLTTTSLESWLVLEIIPKWP